MTWQRIGAGSVAVAVAATVGLGATSAFALGRLPGSIVRVDAVSGGAPPTSGAQALGISSSGRYVLWQTIDTAVVRRHLIQEYYVTDTTTGAVTLVSRTTSGAMLTGLQSGAALSANGRYVAYVSDSTGLPHPASSHEKGQNEVYRYDLQTGDIRTESLTSRGTRPAGTVGSVGISASGRYVVYTAKSPGLSGLPATDHVSGAVLQVYLYDNTTHETTLITRATDGAASDNRAGLDAPQVSADGRYVAFGSYATDLVGPALPRGTREQIYLWDRNSPAGNEIQLISLDSSGQPLADGAQDPSLAAAGTALTYDTLTTGAIPANQENTVVRYGIATGTSTIVNDVFGSQPRGYRLNGRATISADGRYVGYQLSPIGSSSPDNAHVLRYDALTGATRIIYRPTPIQPGQGFPQSPPNSFLSGDGQHDTFTTTPPPITDPADTNGLPDVYEWNAVSPS